MFHGFGNLVIGFGNVLETLLKEFIRAGPPREFRGPVEKRKMRPPASEASRKFLWPRTLLWKIIAVLP